MQVEQHALTVETPIVQRALPIPRFVRNRADMEAGGATACLTRIVRSAAGANDSKLWPGESVFQALTHLFKRAMARAAIQMQIWHGKRNAIKSLGIWQHGAELCSGSHHNSNRRGKRCDKEASQQRAREPNADHG